MNWPVNGMMRLGKATAAVVPRSMWIEMQVLECHSLRRQEFLRTTQPILQLNPFHREQILLPVYAKTLRSRKSLF
jgi:hypothetical protein